MMHYSILYYKKETIQLQNGKSGTVGGAMSVKISNHESAVLVFSDFKTAEKAAHYFSDSSFPLELKKAIDERLFDFGMSPSFKILIFDDFDQFLFYLKSEKTTEIISKNVFTVRLVDGNIELQKPNQSA